MTYGAGAFNLVNAVAGAYAERVPLVVLSGAPAAHEAASGFQLHHQVKTLDSQWRVFEELTVDRARLDDARQAPAAHRARARRGAARLAAGLPRDSARHAAAHLRRGAAARGEPAPDAQALAACADELLQRLRAAQRPMLMVGVEVRRYGLEARVAELARRLAIPVVTSFMGRGLLPARTCRAARHLPRPGRRSAAGRRGRAVRCAAAARRDRLGHQLRASPGKRIDLRHAIQALDGQVTLGHHVYPDLPLARLVDALLERVPVAQRAGARRSVAARARARTTRRTTTRRWCRPTSRARSTG